MSVDEIVHLYDVESENNDSNKMMKTFVTIFDLNSSNGENND